MEVRSDELSNAASCHQLIPPPSVASLPTLIAEESWLYAKMVAQSKTANKLYMRQSITSGPANQSVTRKFGLKRAIKEEDEVRRSGTKNEERGPGIISPPISRSPPLTLLIICSP